MFKIKARALAAGLRQPPSEGGAGARHSAFSLKIEGRAVAPAPPPATSLCQAGGGRKALKLLNYYQIIRTCRHPPPPGEGGEGGEGEAFHQLGAEPVF